MSAFPKLNGRFRDRYPSSGHIADRRGQRLKPKDAPPRSVNSSQVLAILLRANIEPLPPSAQAIGAVAHPNLMSTDRRSERFRPDGRCGAIYLEVGRAASDFRGGPGKSGPQQLRAARNLDRTDEVQPTGRPFPVRARSPREVRRKEPRGPPRRSARYRPIVSSPIACLPGDRAEALERRRAPQEWWQFSGRSHTPRNASRRTQSSSSAVARGASFARAARVPSRRVITVSVGFVRIRAAIALRPGAGSPTSAQRRRTSSATSLIRGCCLERYTDPMASSSSASTSDRSRDRPVICPGRRRSSAVVVGSARYRPSKA